MTCCADEQIGDTSKITSVAFADLVRLLAAKSNAYQRRSSTVGTRAAAAREHTLAQYRAPLTWGMAVPGAYGGAAGGGRVREHVVRHGQGVCVCVLGPLSCSYAVAGTDVGYTATAVCAYLHPRPRYAVSGTDIGPRLYRLLVEGAREEQHKAPHHHPCLLYTSPSPRDRG
eukprot:2091324-Rhodomonas_salina.1